MPQNCLAIGKRKFLQQRIKKHSLVTRKKQGAASLTEAALFKRTVFYSFIVSHFSFLTLCASMPLRMYASSTKETHGPTIARLSAGNALLSG